jgi:hypothetical protein
LYASTINHQQKGNKQHMADYYTNFSVILKLANEAEQPYALDLAHKANLAQQRDELPADFPKALVDMIEDWHFETVADDSSELAYCSTSLPWVSNTLSVASLSAATGNNSLLGRPPAKEITSEWSATFSISRIKERGTFMIRSEKMRSGLVMFSSRRITPRISDRARLMPSVKP